MHRARMCANAPSDYNWYRPKIHFTRGPFDSIMRDFVTKAALASGTENPVDVPGTMFMPVHEMQLPTVLAKFKDVEALEPTIGGTGAVEHQNRARAGLTEYGTQLSVNMKISFLTVELEPASAVYAGVEPSVRKHFTAIFRSEYVPAEGENIIVVAALLEMGHAGVPAGVSAVEHIFGLNTDAKRVKFLDKYLRLACEALIPPVLYNGVVFEAHAQNCLLRFDVATGELLGFVVRDLGGLRVHPATMNASLGTNFEFLAGHCVVTTTVEETYPKFYHTLVHNHLQRIIRLLGMHHNGLGWEMLRGNLRNVIPRDHGLWKAWMETDTVPGKCLMRMRLQSVHDKMVFSPVPNMLLYRPGENVAAVEA
ncbi:hypothetical protein B0H12DRAFT_1152136 [Mycena haematopus]|nr:hypothetical protein B0H12DRAFT_1152136 [Mycena haematopus]